MFEAAMGQAVSAFGGEAVDPGAVWAMVTTSVSSSFGAVIFAFLFASSWVGSRFGAARGARTEPAASVDGVVDSVLEPGDRVARAPTLATYRLPGYLVWALLGAWACLLLNRFVQSPVLSAAALNAALALSICYGVQGLAVAGALAERVGLAPALRFIGPIVLIALIASGAAGFIAVGLLALLGTLETWIPFRAATKGDRP
jgi:hypothetical protein